MKEMFENVAPKHIIAYFIAVFNVILATFGIDGLVLDGEMQEDVQKWMDALTSPVE